VAELKFPVPFWPVGPLVTIAFMLFIFGVLGWFEQTRVALFVGLAWLLLLVAAWWLWVRPRDGALAGLVKPVPAD